MELSLDKINYFRLENVNPSKNKENSNTIKVQNKSLKEEVLTKPSFNSKVISNFKNESLAILQDFETGKTVYRSIDNRTNLIRSQYPRESELARIAFLNRIQEVALKKLNRDES